MSWLKGASLVNPLGNGSKKSIPWILWYLKLSFCCFDTG